MTSLVCFPHDIETPPQDVHANNLIKYSCLWGFEFICQQKLPEVGVGVSLHLEIPRKVHGPSG